MNNTASHHPLGNGEFLLFRELILKRTGLFFSPRRQTEMARHLNPIAREDGHPDIINFYHRLEESRTDSPLWDRVISGLTVGETYFMRDKPQIEALRNHILPEIIERRKHEKRLRLWSAGCASGEEPYSLALLLKEIIPDFDRWSIFILGTDINKDSLAKAQAGLYKKWSFRQCDDWFVQLNFLAEKGRFRIKPETARLVSFSYLNLADDGYPSLMTNTCALDLIICRNVAIYLPEEQVRNMVGRFSRCLSQQGWLMVASTETDPRGFPGFTTRTFNLATAYQLKSEEDRIKTEPEPPERIFKSEPRRVIKKPLVRPVASRFSPRPKPPVQPLADVLPRVRELMDQGRFQSARYLLERSGTRRSARAKLWLKGAFSLANSGQIDEARHWCAQSLELDPIMAGAHHCRALIALEEGDIEAARDHLRKTLFLEPNHLAAHFLLATTYRRLNQTQKASLHARHCIRLAESLPPEQTIPEADGLEAGRIVTMLQVLLTGA